ncbi:MAG: HPr family phosphocarrier protein [Planctomycetes bacterium]|nr:HPr family phosphocarrier protein [Planctomycetota bacterium]
MSRQSVTVNLEEGLHLRPYSLIAQAIRDLDCDVHISNGDLAVDAVNVLDLMTLNANHGTVLQLEATGVDAAEAVAFLVRLFETNFADDSTTAED